MEDWRKKLNKEQYHVLREKGTEEAFSGKLWNEKKPGIYHCAGYGQRLFASGEKFDSGTGWPSFSDALPGTVKFQEDNSHGMARTEVLCSKCGGHLGHVFSDLAHKKRFCINSCALDFKGKGKN